MSRAKKLVDQLINGEIPEEQLQESKRKAVTDMVEKARLARAVIREQLGEGLEDKDE